MARAYVEIPLEWGDQRVIITAWKRAGYRVEREVLIGAGESRLLVSAAESPASHRPGS